MTWQLVVILAVDTALITWILWDAIAPLVRGDR